MTQKLSKLTKITLLFLLLMTVACGGRSSRKFIHPDADMSFYRRVGVIPFKNLASDRFAGVKMTETFTTELMIPGTFDVAPPGEFQTVVQEVTQATAPISNILIIPSQLKAIGKKAKVQGVFMGTVQQYEKTRIGLGEYPLISLNVRFIDTETGTVVWQENYFERGGPKMPILSVGEIFTLGELAQKTARKVISDFYGSDLF